MFESRRKKKEEIKNITKTHNTLVEIQKELKEVKNEGDLLKVMQKYQPDFIAAPSLMAVVKETVKDKTLLENESVKAMARFFKQRYASRNPAEAEAQALLKLADKLAEEGFYPDHRELQQTYKEKQEKKAEQKQAPQSQSAIPVLPKAIPKADSASDVGSPQPHKPLISPKRK